MRNYNFAKKFDRKFLSLEIAILFIYLYTQIVINDTILEVLSMVRVVYSIASS